jgi:hypothetical protein
VTVVWCGFKNVQNRINILGSIVNIIGGGGSIRSINEHENLHFEVDLDIQMSSRNDQIFDYSFDLDLVTTL